MEVLYRLYRRDYGFSFCAKDGYIDISLFRYFEFGTEIHGVLGALENFVKF